MAIPVLPESAPFDLRQRAWLNGFMAGVLSLTGTVSNGSAVSSNGHSVAVAEGATVAVEEEEYPWHDPAMPMEERLQLAEGRPFKLQLMVAMAQLDCGSCGYLCHTYAEAIASGVDKELTKCVPGGKETAKKLKELVAASKAS